MKSLNKSILGLTLLGVTALLISACSSGMENKSYTESGNVAESQSEIMSQEVASEENLTATASLDWILRFSSDRYGIYTATESHQRPESEGGFFIIVHYKIVNKTEKVLSRRTQFARFSYYDKKKLSNGNEEFYWHSLSVEIPSELKALETKVVMSKTFIAYSEGINWTSLPLYH